MPKRQNIAKTSSNSPKPNKRPRPSTDIDTATSEQLEQITALSHEYLLPLKDAQVYYIPNFIDSEAVCKEWYDELKGLGDWYQPKLKMYGKEIVQSRKIAAYTTSPTLSLTYSGQTVDMIRSYPPLLARIQEEVEEKLGVKFNHVMGNCYENGSVYIGNHRDNKENRVIASLSLGAPRTFIMTHDSIGGSKPRGSSGKKKRDGVGSGKKAATAKMDTAAAGSGDGGPEGQGYVQGAEAQLTYKKWVLAPGSLLVMQGQTQQFWKHEIPREKNVKDGRISLTFRQLVYD